MKVIADLHLHSKFSRAVSQEMVVPVMARWAAKKGINLIGTGDFTHPIWLRELQANLEEKVEGVYGPKKGVLPLGSPTAFPPAKASTELSRMSKLGAPSVGLPASRHPLFILSTEISSIYSQGGKTRKIHTVVLAPSFGVVEKINKILIARRANLFSDGRPIVGLTAKQIAEIVFSVDESCLVIPAHAWTPHFSLYGSNSGFDSITDCYEEIAPKIFAIETGLSSDPAMNWRIEELAGRSIVSFSDAHSPAKLGREATIFDLPKVNFENISRAIRKENGAKIDSTIEFYPEEGKYHYTGHRNCNVVYSPNETRKLGAICPVCGRSLTVGVMSRVEHLARGDVEVEVEKDKFGVRRIYPKDRGRPPYVMMVPLLEIVAESLGLGVSSKKVMASYESLIWSFGSEFKILLETDVSDIAKIGGEKLAEGIAKVRSGDIVIEPGYDGVFGKVRIWPSTKTTESKEGIDQGILF
jgi:uncharacterized protein (TIGR00375 family)